MTEGPGKAVGNSAAEARRAPAGGVALFVAIAVCLYLCYLLTKPFLAPLAWALALAIVALPLHERVLIRVKHRNLAAGISTLLVAFFISSAFFFVIQRLVVEANKGIESLRMELESGRLERVIESNPRLAAAIRWAERRVEVAPSLQQATTWLSGKAASIVTGGAWGAVGLLITFFFLFYFFRDHEEALEGLRRLAPLSEEEGTLVFDSVTNMIAATVYGTVIVSMVQGILGGLMFWWLGLPAPALWGLVMGLLGLVPVLGAFVVWVPAAILLALEGSWMKALILTVWGGFVVSLVDNILYPILIGRRIQVHTALVFLALIGGLLVFGASGLVLGPVILAITLALLEVWRRRSDRRLLVA